MEEKDIDKMWRISMTLTFGHEVSEKDREFYNLHFDDMVAEMKDNYEHWKYHAEKLRLC